MRTVVDDEMVSQITDLVMDLQSSENTETPLLKRQLAETERVIKNMLDAIQAGVLTSSTKQRLEELEDTKSKLEVSILQEEIQKPLLTREQIIFWLHKFRATDVNDREHRQKLVDTFVNAVYVYDDKLVLTFNFKDGSKTLSLQDIESSDLFGGALLPCKKPSIDKRNFVDRWFLVLGRIEYD
jgi:hypothetical protein